MSAERVVYSIQRTYILNTISTPEKSIITCDQRIDIPTIEPLPSVQPSLIDNDEQFLTVIPCIELAGKFLSELNLTFETNEGVTVLPVTIQPSSIDSIDNPYRHFRYVLVLPRGATGVKSCKVTYKDRDEEVQHNFTFGIMPPPYNYDNMFFGYSQFIEKALFDYTMGLERKISELNVAQKTREFPDINLSKGDGEQGILLGDAATYFTTVFSYPPTSEETVHRPVISVRDTKGKHSYTLALNRTSQTVLVDLLMSMITVYDSATGEIMQQFKLPLTAFNEVSFNHFDDIVDSTLNVKVIGRPVT